MMLALVVVAGVGVIAFRGTVGALEGFRAETVGETKRIEAVRDLLVLADDSGEIYVESQDPTEGERFIDLSKQIDLGFSDLATLSTPKERELATAARLRWEAASAAARKAASLPPGRFGDSLDPFHDELDKAGSLLADLNSLNVNQVALEISSLRAREQLQLVASLATLIVAFIAGGLLSRRVYRSITVPLHSLEGAAIRFGSDDLSHRIVVRGDDELARVGTAFNSMAVKLQESRDELHHQALHDPLTGLPNRALFIEQMEHAIARARRRGTPISVLYLDLDGFKAVNDTLGHQAGDEVLVAVAERLTGFLRAEDTASRLGGDEFGILLEEDVRGATQVAQRLIHLFTGTWSAATGDLPIGVSIGVATREADEELDQLLRHADAAMYAAKAEGKGRWQVFSPDLDANVLVTQSLRTNLARAVERKEFVIHYQPIVDLQSGRIQSVEALVRWNHPERGLLAPSEFLKEAEEVGNILYIDKWVMQEACRQVRAWQRQIPAAQNLSVHVNLSARELQHPGLAEEIAEVVRSSDLAPEHLVLEITETTLVRDAEAAAKELTKLKELNVRLALDDFGTGFSSLSHLLRFPIDGIKIDGSFVAAMRRDERQSAFVLALVNLGRTLRLQVIAEGIEEAGQLHYLRSIGCEQGQGFFFAEPVGPQQMERLLDSDGATASITADVPQEVRGNAEGVSALAVHPWPSSPAGG